MLNNKELAVILADELFKIKKAALLKSLEKFNPLNLKIFHVGNDEEIRIGVTFRPPPDDFKFEISLDN